jgi:selenocysteine-specific elongation factor
MRVVVLKLGFSQGDRVGICVTQFEAKQLERGLVSSPGALPSISAAIASVSKISYFKGTVTTKAKFHVTIGHDTVMGRVSFFGLYETAFSTSSADVQSFDFTREYRHQDELLSVDHKPDVDQEAGSSGNPSTPTAQFALIEFERPVTCGRNFLVIGSKLDTDIHANVCRIAFSGRLIEPIADTNYAETVLPRVKVFKDRCKEGVVERRADDYTVICRGLFKKESKVDAFVGLKVTLSTGDSGVIEGGFGQSGKFKVRIPGVFTVCAFYINTCNGRTVLLRR